MTLSALTFSETINQDFFIDRLGGPQNPRSLLDRFPEELYNKAPETHFVKLMYSLLGPAGVGYLLKQYLDLRLQLDANGIDLFNLEGFYGDPFKFSRIIDELYDSPPSVLTREQWNEIRARDERYRLRALDFFKGARAGGSPLGMRLVAKSGLGHDVEIIENYKYLFSVHTDEPLTEDYFGSTLKPEEFIVVPRQEKSRSAVQTITITGNPSGGSVQLRFNGVTSAGISWDADRFEAETAIQGISTIGANNALVTGGPAPLNPWVVTFAGPLSNRPLPDLETINMLTGGTAPDISVITTTGGIETPDEFVQIPAIDFHHLQAGLDRIRPQHTIPTTFKGQGIRKRQNWRSTFATSEYTEVLRYVVGNPSVIWPVTDGLHWIERNVEKEAPRVHDDLHHHYIDYHNIVGVNAYTDAALNDPNYLADNSVLPNYISEHSGPFRSEQIAITPYLVNEEDTLHADRALADYPEPLMVTSQASTSGQAVPMISGIYPIDYASLPGTPQIKYKGDQFWSSLERGNGEDFLELDLGYSQFVNFVAFEVSKKPVDIEIDYDLLDLSPRRRWLGVVPEKGLQYPDSISYNPDERTPWFYVEYHFTDPIGSIPVTQFLRISFTRRSNETEPYLFDFAQNVQIPWTIEVRNLRVGRNVSD